MKNSAGVKFNDNTELIIEADPTGEVTSCRNLINGVEYVGGGGFTTATVTVTHSSRAANSQFDAIWYNEESEIWNVNIGNPGTYNIIIPPGGYYILYAGSAQDYGNISGNIEYVPESVDDAPAFHITGDCSIQLNPGF